MSWMVHTGARYHTQDTGYYCGAACAMTVLAEIGVPYSALDQDDLYNSNHSHNAKPTGWATDPYGLRYTLVDRRPAGFTNTFVVHKPTTEAEGTRDIVYTLHTYEVSPAALVFGCAHWITVPGVQTDVEPAPGTSYTVEGLWLHNPVYRDNEPHSASDVCGSGGVNGSANEYVTYADWQGTYFTGCNYDHPSGNAQFISVCDPDVRELDVPERGRLQRLADGHRLLSAKEAVEFSARAIDELDLGRDERVGPLLRRARPLEPQLVVRRDVRNSFYYLVPWGTNSGARALLRVDARFGTFSGLRLVEKPIREEFLDRERVVELLATGRFPFEEHRMPTRFGDAARFEKLPRLKIFREALCVSPTLVWEPCYESWSPNLPFHQVTIGGDTLFVRIDGTVFTQLTRTLKGA